MTGPFVIVSLVAIVAVIRCVVLQRKLDEALKRPVVEVDHDGERFTVKHEASPIRVPGENVWEALGHLLFDYRPLPGIDVVLMPAARRALAASQLQVYRRVSQ